MRVAYSCKEEIGFGTASGCDDLFLGRQFRRNPIPRPSAHRTGKDPQAAENNYYFDVATAHLYFQPEQISRHHHRVAGYHDRTWAGAGLVADGNQRASP